MGLTGIEFLGPNQEVIPLSYDMLKVGEANLLIVSLSLPHSFLFIKTCRIFLVLFFFNKACPRDLNDLPEYEDDDRTLDK